MGGWWSTTSEVIAYATASAMALAGRMLALAVIRPSLSWGLLWELPLVFGMGVIGQGVAEYLGLHGHQESALIAGMAYTGPAGLAAILRMFLRTAGGPKE